MNVTDYVPPNSPATWRFRPSTGQLSMVENTVGQSNGIGISPDGRTTYITATANNDIFLNDTSVVPRFTYNRLGDHGVYAFDLVDSPPGKHLTNKRLIYWAQEGLDDGFQVSSEGYLVTAEGQGAAILSPYGELLVRVEVNHTVNNIQFVNMPSGWSDVWLLGSGGISRAAINLTGMATA